jgi:hypothetical protein
LFSFAVPGVWSMPCNPAIAPRKDMRADNSEG